jgi:hypothetical protein
MTLKTNPNRKSNVAVSYCKQLLAGRTRVVLPTLRRAAHLPGDFLAGAILVPLSGDVSGNLQTSADDFAGVTPDANAAVVVLAGGASVLAKANSLNEVGFATALDDEDEDEDDYDDDDLDEEDDEDLDDEDDAEFDDEDDLADDDDDLDDDDVDDEDEEDDEE